MTYRLIQPIVVCDKFFVLLPRMDSIVGYGMEHLAVNLSLCPNVSYPWTKDRDKIKDDPRYKQHWRPRCYPKSTPK